MIYHLRKFILSSILHLFFVSALSLFGFLYFFGETTSGLKTLIRLVSPFLPGDLSIAEIQGKLFSNIAFTNFAYHSPTNNIRIGELEINWSFSKLLNHQLKINKITSNNIQVNILNNTNKPFDFSSLKVLKNISAKEIELNNLTISQGSKHILIIPRVAIQKTTKNSANFQMQMLKGHLQGNINYDWSPTFHWSLNLLGNDLNPQEVWTDLPGKIQFELNIYGNSDSRGKLSTLYFKLQNVQGSLRDYPLSGNVFLETKNETLQIHQAKINIGTGSAKFVGSINNNWNLNWDINIPNLYTIIPSSKGALITKGLISGPIKSPRIEAKVQGNNLEYANGKIKTLLSSINFNYGNNLSSSSQVTAYDVKIKNYIAKKIELRVTQESHFVANNILSQFGITLADKQFMTGNLVLPKTWQSYSYTNLPIFANFHFDIPDLAYFKDYLPNVKNPNGLITGDINVRGNFKTPLLKGELKLSNANFSLSKLGITLKNTNLILSGNQARQIQYKGDFQSGDGYGSLTGTTDLTKPNWPTELLVTGKNLQAVNLSDYKIQISPDLKIHASKSKVKIDGSVEIPKAELTPKDFRQIVSLPDEVVFIGKTQKPALPLLFSMPEMNLFVKMDNVYIHHQDLTTTVAGKLDLKTSPNQPTTAKGELYSKGGTYHAYGKDLSITSGRLIFTGGMINNPGLNIKASKEVNTVAMSSTGNFTKSQTFGGNQVITVGVQILGTLDKPNIVLFSQPALSPDDILSYLLLGIPRSQANKITDGVELLNATSAFNVGGAGNTFSNLTKKLQNGLGLTELNVESVQMFDPTANNNNGEAVGKTSLVLGKKIADKLYVHYSVSLFSASPVTTWNLRYQLSKHWSLQSETSTIDNGADLLYSIERD